VSSGEPPAAPGRLGRAAAGARCAAPAAAAAEGRTAAQRRCTVHDAAGSVVLQWQGCCRPARPERSEYDRAGPGSRAVRHGPVAMLC